MSVCLETLMRMAIVLCLREWLHARGAADWPDVAAAGRPGKSASGIGILLMLLRVMFNKGCLESVPYTKQLKSSVSVKKGSDCRILFLALRLLLYNMPPTVWVDWTLAFSAEAASTLCFAVQHAHARGHRQPSKPMREYILVLKPHNGRSQQMHYWRHVGVDADTASSRTLQYGVQLWPSFG
jgi:hypothetical protein